MFTVCFFGFLINILYKIGKAIGNALNTDSYYMGTEFWLSFIAVLLFLNLFFNLPFVKNFKILDK